MRSELMMAINKKIETDGFNQTEATACLGIRQPRVSALSQGRIDSFRIDTLVNFAHRLGLRVSIKIGV